MSRARLPERRPSMTMQFVYEANNYSVTLGFDVANDRIGEVFTHGAKIGSAMDRILDDACVALSLLLQHGVAPDALQTLHSHRWPGNIGELRNVIGRAAILCASPEITAAHLPPDLVSSAHRLDLVARSEGPQLPPTGLDLKSVVAELELDLIHQALERAGGNQTLAAQLLHISRDELRYRLKKYKANGET